MNGLNIFEFNSCLVTDSREVAEMVRRPHNELMKTIRTYVEYLGLGEIPHSEFFIESEYQNSQNKTQPCYLLTKKGCDMVANKMTGEKGVLFTAVYVTRFEEMEKKLTQQPSVLTKEQQRREHLKLSIETSERLDHIEVKLDGVINTMRIDGVEQQKLKQNGGVKVIQALGGNDSNAYQKVSRRMFKALWGEFNRYFNIPRYSELPKVNYEEGLKFIDLWQPSTALKMEIEQCNRQAQLKLVYPYQKEK